MIDEILKHAIKLAPELVVLVYLVVKTNNNLVTISREHNDALEKMADRLAENTAEVRATKELARAGLVQRLNGDLRQPLPEANAGQCDAPGSQIHSRPG